MKKDLIIIGAYCPDTEREKLLVNCINSLKGCRDRYDILISSHSYIPEYIAKEVDYTVFDKDNDVISINDIEYMNQPWFRPMDNYSIVSPYIANHSTFLSCYRVLIAGIGMARTYSYNKIHFIEYDSVVKEIDEIHENSKLLDNHDAVFYNSFTNSDGNGDDWYNGNFFSFNLDSVPEIFERFDRDKLLKILKESNRKSNEHLTYLYFNEKNENIYLKNSDFLGIKMITRLSDLTKKEAFNYWTVPFYDRTEDVLKVISFNNLKNGTINVNYIINDSHIISHKSLDETVWRINSLGNINEVNKIVCVINDTIKYVIDFENIDLEKFKMASYGDIFIN